MKSAYDAVLVLSFGGPEKHEDVIPFLENVLRGRHVPRERMLEVAEHYYHFDGRSPINDQNRALIDALRLELAAHGPDLPVYWGNRNWYPLLTDTLREMQADGVTRALAFVTSAFSSYSGCRQYREDIDRARAEIGDRVPAVDKIRVFFNHPGFINAMISRVGDALQEFAGGDRSGLKLIYTAHSVPTAMATGSDYVAQLNEAARLISESVGVGEWKLAYQSRSGPPTQPWLEPDICDRLRELHSDKCRNVCVVPLGFISDHMEVLFDLDTEAAALATELGIRMVRAGTVGTHPAFIAGIRDLIDERVSGSSERAVVGRLPSCPDICAIDCCPAPARPSSPRQKSRARDAPL